MGTYNVNKIEDWYKDFTSVKNKFNNTYYSDYKNSYIRSCSDSVVIRMRNKLNQHYAKIARINNRIDNTWNDFIQDLKAIDNRLAGGKGSANDSTIASKLSKLPTLKEYKADLKVRINSASAVVGTVDAIGWAEDRSVAENIDYVLDRTEATITTFGVSVIEGVAIFVEGLIDLCSPIVTEGYCQFNLAFNEDFTEETAEEARQNARDFVSKEHVKSWFDEGYENSPELKASREKAYGFETVRSIGNEVGEVVGAVTVSALTQGAVNPAVLYGASKAGNHIEENFQDENNEYFESILKGSVEGVFDGLFFAAGMKGDAVMKSVASNTLKNGGKQVLKKGAILFGKTFYEAECSVAQDFSSILIDAVFSDDTIKNSNGQTIKFDSFGDKLNYYYQQAGGAKGLITSMTTASILSFASDFVDVNKISKNIDINRVTNNIEIDGNDIQKSIKGVNPQKVEISSGSKAVNTNANLDSIKKEYDELINWKNSEDGLYSKRFYEVYGDRFGTNGKYRKNIERINELEKILNENNQFIKNKKVNVKTNENLGNKVLLKRKDTTLAQNLDSYNFNKLSIIEQEKYIKDCNVNQLKELISSEDIVKKYSKIIDEKILKNQDQIFIKGLAPLGFSSFKKYIFDNEYVLENLSNDNLVLLIGSSYKDDSIDMALKEAEKRIKEGYIIFEGNVIRKGLFNIDNNYTYNAIKKMPNEIQKFIINNGREISAKLPIEIQDIDYGNTGLFQKISLGKMYANGELDSSSIKLIKNINDNGIGGLSKANTKLFNKEIIHSLGEDYIIEIMNYPELSKKVVSLFNSDKRLFDSFSKIMKKNLEDNSLNTFYLKNESYLNFIFDNQETLKNVNSSILESDAFMNYVLYNSNSYNIKNLTSKKIPVDFSTDYEKKLAQYCDNLFNKSIATNNIKNAKEAYFQKYFSISYDEAKTFVSKYSDHIDEVIKYDNNQTANTVINLFKKIDEAEDLSYLKKLYDTQKFNFTAEEMINLDSTIKEVYSNSYVDKLSQTNDYIKNKLNQNHEIIDFNGKKVDIIDIDDNFNFVVHSSDTGYVADKELINNSYIDTWKSISPETHGLSTSYISNENIGSAPVGGTGVLYAFNDINAKDIGIMAPYDVNGNVANYGFSSGNKQIYISADEMSNNTLRVYNELVLDRKNVKPSHVIVYTDMPKESVDSAIKAASEWDVPVVRINKINLANKQLAEINNLINNFNKSGDLDLLDQTLNKYEANVAGYKLNSNVKEGATDATSSINNDIVADLFNSSHIENTIMDYLSKTDNEKNINELIDIMQNIRNKYDIVNSNGTKIVANTKSSFDIDTLIEMAKEKIGV